MGANGCNGMCEKTAVVDSFDDQFLPTQTLIPCQVCNVHLDEARFKEHIDHYHFCTIYENTEGVVNAQCLLCGHLAHSLDEQARHIAEKHPFAKNNNKPQDQKAIIITEERTKPQELYKAKKERVVKLLSEKEFQVLSSQGQDRVQASIRGEKYEADLQSKQYRGLEFEQHLAEGELIWYKVFQADKHYQYYYLDVDPKDRTILCKAYLFAHQS